MRVLFSPQAMADLQNMYNYIAPRGGKAVAEAYVSSLYKYCLSMETFPKRGKSRDDIYDGLRFVGFKRKATIAIELNDNEVRIVRILGRGQNVEAEFT